MLNNTELETILPILEKLTPETQPLWGAMSAQRMIEHLSDAIAIATEKIPVTAVITDPERIVKMQHWLTTDAEMAHNIEVPFAGKNVPLRNEEIELALDELVDELLYFEEYFAGNDSKTSLHPFYGQLNYTQWQLLNKKHLTHHFKQFGLI